MRSGRRERHREIAPTIGAIRRLRRRWLTHIGVVLIVCAAALFAGLERRVQAVRDQLDPEVEQGCGEPHPARVVVVEKQRRGEAMQGRRIDGFAREVFRATRVGNTYINRNMVGAGEQSGTLEVVLAKLAASNSEARRLVQQGASAQRLVEELGLSESEASLIYMIHGGQS